MTTNRSGDRNQLETVDPMEAMNKILRVAAGASPHIVMHSFIEAHDSNLSRGWVLSVDLMRLEETPPDFQRLIEQLISLLEQNENN
jgi:hypothetical protein